MVVGEADKLLGGIIGPLCVCGSGLKLADIPFAGMGQAQGWIYTLVPVAASPVDHPL